MTDEGVSQLVTLHILRRFWQDGCLGVSDAGLASVAALAALGGLGELHFGRTQV